MKVIAFLMYMCVCLCLTYLDKSLDIPVYWDTMDSIHSMLPQACGLQSLITCNLYLSMINLYTYIATPKNSCFAVETTTSASIRILQYSSLSTGP